MSFNKLKQAVKKLQRALEEHGGSLDAQIRLAFEIEIQELLLEIDEQNERRKQELQAMYLKLLAGLLSALPVLKQLLDMFYHHF
ncbi:unnamed protein product [Commensalibacter communis]|uniref:Uncharacterized protein n=1 Tax=Commensalibacter communis TaxID=2972786 RepID=A0A9W4TPB7_9PROT|nr:hypothetical protein [Commensalibacter communis]CAI3939693.1 unnamed protein product [Commensalibacter communis]CAI3940662.1 unnamed protein product [Commensalibacter communis]CAI3942822.1 unnamed protein product [Commensalibacter communis]CAI3946938.1 unnamed protein product [Commensalibacter communis]CAI3947043.1 unnamed protein product [Commensalibacter communis]